MKENIAKPKLIKAGKKHFIICEIYEKGASPYPFSEKISDYFSI